MAGSCRKFILLFLRLIYIYCIISLCMFNVCICLYEDQVGLFDWRQQYIGSPKEVYFEESTHTTKRAFVSTEANVLAAINARTGQIVWRRIFEKNEGTIQSLLYSDKYLITVSGRREKLIRSWDKNKGNLIWEFTKSNGRSLQPNDASDNVLTNHQAELLSEDIGGLLFKSDNSVTLTSQSDGTEIWTYEISDANINILGVNAFEEKQVVVSICLKKSSLGHSTILFKHLNIESGKLITEFDDMVPWFTDQTVCEIVAAKFLVCIDNEKDSIYFKDMFNSDEDFQMRTFSEVGVPTSTEISIEKLSSQGHKSNVFVLRSNSDHSVLIQIDNSGKVTKVKELMKPGIFSHVVQNEKQYIFEIKVEKKLLSIDVFDATDMKEPIAQLSSACPIENISEASLKAAIVYMYSKKKNPSYRMLLTFEDNSIHLLQYIGNQKSKLLWSRDEALSTINQVQMIELPPSASAFKLEMLHNEFAVKPNTGVMTMFVNRIKSQIRQLQAFANTLRNKQHNDEDSYLKNEAESDKVFSRDQFDIVKMIIVLTKSRKVFGINSQNGEIKWSKFMKGSKYGSVMNLFEQRTTAHFPLPPQCMLIIQNPRTTSLTPQTLVYTFNPLTGDGLDEPSLIENYETLNVNLLPYEDANSLKIVATVDINKNIHFYPNTQSVLNKVHDQLDSIYIYLTNKTINSFNGYKIQRHRDEFHLYEVWAINIPEDQEIISIQSKRNDEVVNSVGRVLGDLQVLFKYLNPNVILALTQQGDGLKGNFFVYLIDAVTGHILYHARHKGAGHPIKAILSEHWLVYLYFNSKGRRYEMSVVEFYEGYEEKNHTAFSSLDPVDHPMILSQGYLLPVTGVSALTATNTLRGITSKNVLIGLDNGFVYSIPKNFLDPRRSFKHTPVLQEEGLPPYTPELPIFPQGYVNYNQTVANIRGIHTAAAGLESTSLVFVYGLDIFYTRVTPSKMFDVLKEDFDYIFISGVLSILIIISIVFSKLASMRQLKLAWQ